MTFYARMVGSITAIQWAELLLRIVVAAICGWLVGVERSRRFKDAGVRTHSMVACTAALLMIISKYGFTDLGTDGTFFPGARGADPARIAAQIVSGVSFLGAGVIYRDRKFTTRGLTTAAGVWAVAGIGMAIGAGLYVIGAFATAFIIFMQFIMHRINVGADRYSDAGLDVVFSRGDGDADEELYRQLEKWGVIVTDTQIEKRSNGSVVYHLGLKLKNDIKGSMLNDFVNAHSEVVSIKMTNMQPEN